MEFFQKSLKIAMVVSLISGIGVAFSGHSQAQYLMETQPMKMAASEALWEDSEDPAAWSLIADMDTEEMKNNWSIDIPFALSLLAYNKFEGSVEGMKTLQATYEKLYGEGVNYIPPVKTVFWSFRIMVVLGFAMVLAAMLGLFFDKKKTLASKPWLLKALMWMIPMPFIASTAGWIMTEIGRQPWTVFGLFTTAQSCVTKRISR